ncbi:MAG: tetratricopeptide repeat protein [Phycisphaerales bacterium]|nr:MAG: tetratricopeptide repeat protein [Phycisphaerales bacterium]
MESRIENLMITAALLLMAPCTGALRADVVAYWDMDEMKGNIVRDRCGGHDGKFNSSPEWVDGRFGGALFFDGAGDFVNCGGGKKRGEAETWADIGKSITVAAWIKVRSFVKDYHAIVTKGDTSWRLARNGNSNAVEFAGNGDATLWFVRGNINVNDGKWHHIAGVYEGTDAALYVDGVLDNSVSRARPISGNTYDVCIGANQQRSGRMWHGAIDDVIIFDHALNAAEIGLLYTSSGAPFLSESVGRLRRAEAEVEQALKKQKPEATIELIRRKIAECRQVVESDPNCPETYYRLVTGRLYFHLAIGLEASGAASDDVADAYRLSAVTSMESEYSVSALLWLYKHRSVQDYADAAAAATSNSIDSGAYLHSVAREFESNGNWPTFKLFLDATLPRIDDAAAWARAITKGLNQNGVWAHSFRRYCLTKAELAPYIMQEYERLAEDYVKLNEFFKAAEAYREIIALCPPERRMAYDFKLGKCMFQGGDYAGAISSLDKFIGKYKATDIKMVMEAIILKGRAYLQSNDTERASEVFLDLTVNYPEAKKVPEAVFFIGYCNMLQGNLEAAKEAFEILKKDYPDSVFSSKANLFHSRIAEMENR